MRLDQCVHWFGITDPDITAHIRKISDQVGGQETRINMNIVCSVLSSH